MSRVRVWIATVFGVGWFPIASGTAGSLVTLPLAYILARQGAWVYGIATLVLIGIAIWSAEGAERTLASKDPHAVVIDEVAGQLIALFLVPAAWITWTGGFLLFRLFDIVKPPPARRFERIRGGAGIVLDDLVAGVYANLVLQAACAVLARRAG